MKIIIALSCVYYAIVLVCLMTNEVYFYKKSFLIDLIPFAAIFRMCITAYRNLS
jgi:hypothetical protein